MKELWKLLRELFNRPLYRNLVFEMKFSTSCYVIHVSTRTLRPRVVLPVSLSVVVSIGADFVSICIFEFIGSRFDIHLNFWVF